MKVNLMTKMIAARYFLIIFFSTFLILESNATNSNLKEIKTFSVYSSCSESDCTIYLNHLNKTKVFDDKPGTHKIEKIDDSLYQIIYSCGNPCSNNVFINAKGLEDWTDKLVARKENCLIEYNLEDKKFVARTVFSHSPKVILKLDNRAHDSAIPIWFYSKNSHFEHNTLVINIKQKFGSDKNFKFVNPCGFSK